MNELAATQILNSIGVIIASSTILIAGIVIVTFIQSKRR